MFGGPNHMYSVFVAQIMPLTPKHYKGVINTSLATVQQNNNQGHAPTIITPPPPQYHKIHVRDNHK